MHVVTLHFAIAIIIATTIVVSVHNNIIKVCGYQCCVQVCFSQVDTNQFLSYISRVIFNKSCIIHSDL